MVAFKRKTDSVSFFKDKKVSLSLNSKVVTQLKMFEKSNFCMNLFLGFEPNIVKVSYVAKRTYQIRLL